MLFLWYPKCTTCQKAKQWLDEHEIPYETRDIKLQNPTEAELREWLQTSNTSGLAYRALALKDKLPDMAQDEQLELLAADGMLVKRPILIGKDFVLAGFRPAEWETAFQHSKE